MPHAYPPRADLGPDCRTAIYGRYLIVFRDLPEAAYVLRIVHGARDLPRLFRQ
jgi:toxin ParE1/3/4